MNINSSTNSQSNTLRCIDMDMGTNAVQVRVWRYNVFFFSSFEKSKMWYIRDMGIN